MPIERKLAAIMFTDIAGYTALSAKDETKALKLLDTQKQILTPIIEDTSYLETAYNQVQEKADNLEPDVAAKFLSYPIPKAIVEEWEKVK